MSEVVECEVCEKSFDTHHGLSTHKSMVHGKPELSCKVCGKVFKVQPDRINTAKYCSNECQHKSLKVDRITVNCENCGKSLKKREKEVKKWESHFCDINCRANYFTKENHPRWNGGYAKLKGAKYGPNWQSWRSDVIDRDKVCQRCEKVPDTNTVHHIKPVREFLDEGKELSTAHSYDNLVLLCRKCHGIVDANWNKEKQKEELL